MSSLGPHDWIGQTLADRYHVTETIGAGGMGTIFKASDTRLDAEVVVKVPHPVMIKDAEFAARFRREIRSLVKLSHPNIVKVMDVGVHDGLPFAVMQYLSGGSLEDRPRPCTPEEVAAWLPDVTEALDFMHAKSLVHRDIKPGNILFDSLGRAYLGDFGIAKVMAEGKDADQKLTSTGSMIGTAEYMAPEMLVPTAFKEAYNQRADQYSLAVTVYEMLSGRTPFRGESMAEVAILLATKNATVLHERNPAVGEDVSRVVARALRKKPEKRFESCQEFAEVFSAAVRGEPLSSVVTPKRQEQSSGTSRKGSRRATQAEATGNPATPRTPTIQKSLSTLSESVTTSETPRTPTIRESLSTLSGSVTTSERVDSPDLLGTRAGRGETVREQQPRGKDESGGPATGNLFIRRFLLIAATIFTIAFIISAALMLITFPGGFEDPIANDPDKPDPAVMGPTTNGPARDTTNPLGSTAIKETLTLKGHSSYVSSVRFSPDGNRIVSESGDGTIKVWDAETGQETLTLGSFQMHVTGVSFSPDGKRIVSGGGGFGTRFTVWNAETGTAMVTFEGHKATVGSVSFSPDGKRIVSRCVNSTMKVWDSETGKETLTLKGYGAWMSWVGNRIVSGGVDDQVRVWNVETGQNISSRTLKGRGTTGARSVSVSPDGTRIVCGGGGPFSKPNEIKVWNAETGQEMLILRGHSDGVCNVSFSLDGKQIVSGSFDKTVKVWDADTGQETLRLKGHSGQVRSVSFSPDGKRIVSGSTDKTIKIWDIPSLDTSK